MQNTTEEQWKPVVDFEDRYEVSNLGRVRQLVKMDARGRSSGGKLKKPDVNHKGYCRVSLSKNGLTIKRSVHSLVLEAFVGPRPPGHEGCHDDRNPANNALSNLRWGTRADNEADKKRHGSHRGERHHAAKISEKQALKVKGMLKAGISPKEVSKKLAIARTTVHGISGGYTWRHLT